MYIYIYTWPRAKTLLFFGASFWVCADSTDHPIFKPNAEAVTNELGVGSFANKTNVFSTGLMFLLMKPIVFYMDCAELG